MPQDLVSVPEVAQILGVTTDAFTKCFTPMLISPKPEAVLAVGRIWKREDIVAWAKSHPRKRGRPPRV